MADTNFRKAIKPLLIYARIMGLVTFKFTANKYEKSRLNAALNFLLVVVYVSLIAASTKARMDELDLQDSRVSLFFTTDFMVSVSAGCQTAIAWMCSAFNQGKYIELMDKIQAVDREFRKLGVWIFYENAGKRINAETFGRILFALSVCLVQVYAVPSDNNNYCWYFSMIMGTTG